MKSRVVMNRLLALLLCVVLAVCAAGCGKKEEKAEEPAEEEVQEPEEDPEPAPIVHEEGKYYVGVILEVDCESYRAALNGFESQLAEEMGDQAVLDIRVGGNKAGCEALAQRYIDEKDDMILAIGTAAVTAAYKATDSVPVMGLCVADYVVTGAASTREEPGANVTGVADLPPLDKQYNYITRALPKAKKIGIVYGTEVDSIYQIELFRRYAKKAGFECIKYQAEDEETLRQALQKACDETDVLYMPTDALLLNNTAMIREVTVAARKPVLCSDRGTCRECGLLCYGVDYEKTGKKAAQMSAEILKRKEGNHPDSYGRTSTMRAEMMKGTAKGYCNPVIGEAIGWENTAELRELDVPKDLLVTGTEAQEGEAAEGSDNGK